MQLLIDSLFRLFLLQGDNVLTSVPQLCHPVTMALDGYNKCVKGFVDGCVLAPGAKVLNIHQLRDVDMKEWKRR